MKINFVRATLGSFTAVLFLCLAASVVLGQEATPWSQNVSPLPPPIGHVNDYAGVMDEATKQQLETRLRDFKNRTNPQVELAVAVVRTTGERPIFDYSLAVARGWGIGTKEDDNPSALLFVAIDDRKYFTQISKDLEDELPDGIAGSLQRQYLVPEFRKGNYAKGIADTMDAYMRQIESKAGTAASPANDTRDRPTGIGTQGSVSGTLCCLIGVVVLIILIFASRGGGGGGRRRSSWGGGGFGSALPWIIASTIANSGRSSGSSWGGSSDWGGGGGGWGGFGGGGDFGGGGAGGDW